MNTMDCLYKENPIKIDIAGSVESISEITPDVLYKCYNTFYNPSNMVMAVCGNFVPEEILEEIKKRLVEKEEQGEIKRIYPAKEKEINKTYKEAEMEVSLPMFAIGFKDTEENADKKELVNKHIAIEILLNMIIGKSSDVFKKLYENGTLLGQPDLDYEFSDEYAHIVISGQSKDPEQVKEQIVSEIERIKQEGLADEHFNRIKRKIYGDYVAEYNSVGNIARMFLADTFKGINSFDYIENYDNITKEYTKNILDRVFKEENMAMSVVKCRDLT